MMMMRTIEEQLLAAVGELRGVEAANRLCEVCVTALGVHAAAISVVYGGSNVATLGASSAAALTYDEVQFTVGEGPCLDSVARRAPVVVIDLADPTEVRWPKYRPAMLAHRIRGVSAMPVMVTGECVGALDLFLMSAGHLDSERLAAALLAADLAQLPLLDLLDDELRSAAIDFDAAPGIGLHIIVRTEVAQATGMLMAQLDIGPTEALVRLRAHAYATATSATHVARAIIDRHLRFDQP
jgi:hypothetical protein